MTGRAGWLAIELDADDTSPQPIALSLARLVRDPGSVVSFHASNVGQGALATNAGPNMLTVTLLDGGASLAQVGGSGGVGAVNRKLVLGVFGGDAGDIASPPWTSGGTDALTIAPNRADEFMTMEGNRLRTLRDDEMVHFGGRATNFLNITQADAQADANVNIQFRATTVVINASTNGPGGSLNMVKNRILGDVTWNALRIGIATNFTGATANEMGRTILLDRGRRLTLESGMLLVGRDTQSATGDDNPGGAIYLWRGILDLDGANNDREAIVHLASGHSLLIRSRIEAANGLTKSGDSGLWLDVANDIAGAVTVPQGPLYLRDPAALGSATEIVLTGTGWLRLHGGGSYNPADIVVMPLFGGGAPLVSESHHNVWNGNLRLWLADPTGLTHHEPQLVVGEASQNPTLTMNGDIALDGPTPSADIWLNDPSRLTLGSSAGILNLRGTVGDIFVGGQARPFLSTGATHNAVSVGDITNRISTENAILRVRIDGPALASYGDELAVNIYNPWKATGRLFAEQGTIRFLGDPAQGKGEFWDAETLTNANFANGHSGFQLGGPGTDAGGSVTLLLTRNGQSFNAERWTATTDQTNSTLTIGLEHFGPLDSTVTIGNSFNDPSPSTEDNWITMNRAVRFFAHNGYNSAAGTASVGRVNIVQSLRGDAASRFVKIGDGQVWLQGPDHAS